MRWTGTIKRAGSFFKNEPARQIKPAHVQLSPCNSKGILREPTTDYQVGFQDGAE